MTDEEKPGELTNKVVFTAYSPQVKPLGNAQGGGFRVTLDVSETDWDRIKDLNSPTAQQMLFTVLLQGENIK